MIRIASIFLCIAPGTLVTAAEPTGPLGAKLDLLVSRYAEYGLSATVLAAKKGQVVLHKGYGLADRERGIANSPDTLFEMGSITKTFTAAALLHLEMRIRLVNRRQAFPCRRAYPSTSERSHRRQRDRNANVSRVVALVPWDAGTDSGVTFLSADRPTRPRQAIARITTPPLAAAGVAAPLGRFTFRRIG